MCLHLRTATAVAFLAASALLVTAGAGAAPSVTRTSYVQVSAGNHHTCAVTVGRGVKCWGINTTGQSGTGDNNRVGYLTPVDVAGLARGVRAIDAGSQHTCALTTAGAVTCWGLDHDGRLGFMHRAGRLLPRRAAGLARGVAAISAGDNHTCALTTAGGVRCWGAGSDGQLGNGQRTRTMTPVGVVGLDRGVRAVSAGGGSSLGFTCAVTDAGGAKCWGAGYGGQLGNGALTRFQPVPVDVVGLTSGVRAVSTGIQHACALTTAGGVKCWGSNTQGQLGNGARPGTSTTPVDVAGLASGVSALVTGGGHSCALVAGGAVKCWGINNDGQLGNGTTTSSNTPVDVVGLGGPVKGLSAGLIHVCALMSAGSIKCWGSNSIGQLGDGTKVRRTRPVDVRPAAAAPAPRAAPAPSTTTAALRSFADRIGGILRQSAAGRRALARALTAGFTCASPHRMTAARVDRVVANRRGLLRQLATLEAPGAHAGQAVRLLRQALQHSVEADVLYRDGFRALGTSGCPLPPNRSFTLARRSDTSASAAKRRFVAVYNPLARRVGRRTWSADEI
jgi:alpha-tubulin suppressor-like RCC1 family protein